jgi:hypothetical protein
LQLGLAADVANASRAFRPAHEHEWFNTPETVLLKEWAQKYMISFAVVKHFTNRRIVDLDLGWLIEYPDRRFLQDLGLTAGQSALLRGFARNKIEEARDAEAAEALAAAQHNA